MIYNKSVMDNCMENLRRNLIDEMIRRDLSAVHMSIECNIAYETLCGILRHKYRDMRISTLGKIAEGLGRSAESLITYPEEKENGGKSKA